MVLWPIAIAIVAVLLFQLVSFVFKTMTRPSDYPPGPRSIPILGSLHLLGEFPERGMLELAMKYGNIFSLKLADKNFVCVCGFEANRDALMKMKLTDRRVIYAFKMAKGSQPSGIIHNEHASPLLAYRELVHDLFVDKIKVQYTVERVIKESISKVMKDFEKFSITGEAAPVTATLFDTGLDVILKILFGTGIPNPASVEYSEVMALRDNITNLPKHYVETSFMLPEIIPGIPKFLLPKSSKDFLLHSEEIMNYAKKEVAKHKKTFDQENLRDLVDCYILKMKQEEENKETQPAIFTEHNLLAIIYDFFIAGFANMHCVTSFATLYLAGHQKVQQRIWEEITRVLGSSEATDSFDIKKMPYTKATTSEVFRYSNIAPNGVPRKASKPFKFHGYSIPKGTTFLLNPYSSHFQEDKWKNPMNFNPENFLNNNGEYQPNEAYMPFGLGLRKCPADKMMENLVSVFIVALVQRFEIRPESKLDYEPLPGLVATPKPQQVRLILRR